MKKSIKLILLVCALLLSFTVILTSCDNGGNKNEGTTGGADTSESDGGVNGGNESESDNTGNNNSNTDNNGTTEDNKDNADNNGTTEDNKDNADNNGNTEDNKDNTGDNSGSSDDKNDNTGDDSNNNTGGDNADIPAVDTTEEKYAQACRLIDNGEYSSAYSILKEINTYEPAKEKLKNFLHLPGTVTEQGYGSVKYKYDANGNITEMQSGSDTYAFMYNADGNIVSGVDLIYTFNYYNYTYQNGKLYQVKSTDSTRTYSYNSKGNISKVNSAYSNWSYDSIYEYTYYGNGNIKTLLVDESTMHTYNEEGQLTSVVVYEDYEANEAYYTFTLSYDKNGLCGILAQSAEEAASYTYTYDADGVLTKLECKVYYSGKLDRTDVYTFTDYSIVYSENPNVHERASIVNYTHCDAFMDVVM